MNVTRLKCVVVEALGLDSFYALGQFNVEMWRKLNRLGVKYGMPEDDKNIPPNIDDAAQVPDAECIKVFAEALKISHEEDVITVTSITLTDGIAMTNRRK